MQSTGQNLRKLKKSKMFATDLLSRAENRLF